MLQAFDRPVATHCYMLGVVGSNLTIFKREQADYMSTRRNRVVKRSQHDAPKNVAICSVDMLQFF